MTKMSISPFGVTFDMTLGSISNLKAANPTNWATLCKVSPSETFSVTKGLAQFYYWCSLLQVVKTRDHYCIISFAISRFSSQEKLHVVDLPSGFKIMNTSVQNNELVPSHLPMVTYYCSGFFFLGIVIIYINSLNVSFHWFYLLFTLTCLDQLTHLTKAGCTSQDVPLMFSPSHFPHSCCWDFTRRRKNHNLQYAHNASPQMSIMVFLNMEIHRSVEQLGLCRHS